ncbi:MAG: hypothetical protein IT473_00675, partial [Lysobacter sp.]|nr:hypothetical protein [Lysobacter sp.]
ERYTAPEGALEEALSSIWGELLGVARVGRDDHFFALGGHSLLLVQLALRIRDRCSVDLPVDVLVRTPILHTMAAAVRERQFEAYLGADADSLAQDLEGLSHEELLALLAQEQA